MNESMNKPARGEACRDAQLRLQDYLDGELDRERALEIFLHARDCSDCGEKLAQMKALFGRLGDLGAIPPPKDFDARVLASVPYEAYREMEPIRRERVPVILTDEFLPAFVRAPATRAGGALVAAGLACGVAARMLPDATAILVFVGLLPELLIRVQKFARRLHGTAERTGGA